MLILLVFFFFLEGGWVRVVIELDVEVWCDVYRYVTLYVYLKLKSTRINSKFLNNLHTTSDIFKVVQEKLIFNVNKRKRIRIVFIYNAKVSHATPQTAFNNRHVYTAHNRGHFYLSRYTSTSAQSSRDRLVFSSATQTMLMAQSHRIAALPLSLAVYSTFSTSSNFASAAIYCCLAVVSLLREYLYMKACLFWHFWNWLQLKL